MNPDSEKYVVRQLTEKEEATLDVDTHIEFMKWQAVGIPLLAAEKRPLGKELKEKLKKYNDAGSGPSRTYIAGSVDLPFSLGEQIEK